MVTMENRWNLIVAEWALVWAIVCLLGASSAAAKYSGGTGEPNSPYRIATAEDLHDIGNHVEDFNKHFVVVNDVNLADYTGTQFNIVGTWSNRFRGTFDGNGHEISNFTYNPASTVYYVGLFGCVEGGIIENLGVREPNIDAGAADSEFIGALVGDLMAGSIANCWVAGGRILGQYYVGGLVGANRGSISNCYVTSDISGSPGVGGLAGFNESLISSCHVTGNVSGVSEVGGLVGGSSGSMAQISKSYATGDVQGHGNVGGLVGFFQEGLIYGCHAKGSVSADRYLGGLVGRIGMVCRPPCPDSRQEISNCYAIGSVAGDDLVGGLVGAIDIWPTLDCHITNCYSAGGVSGSSDVGGLIGRKEQGLVVDSFWDVEASDCNSSAGGMGLSTGEMQKESTFTDAGWDFVEVWGIGEGQTYPHLGVHPGGDVNHDDRVDWLDLAILAGHWLEAKG
jgi:hypothetical protein